MNNFIVGIDIGSSKVCAAVGRYDKQGKIQIEVVSSVSCSGIQKGIIIDIEETSEAIRSCVKKLEDTIETRITRAHISLPMGICELVNNKGVISIANEEKKIENADVRRVLEAAQLLSLSSDNEIVGVIPIEFMIDGKDKVKDPIGALGSRLEVDTQLITSNTDAISDLFRCFNRAGIKIDGMIFQPLAAAEDLLDKNEVEAGVAFVDVGSDTVGVSVFKNNSFRHSDMFSLGGSSITKDISKIFKIPFEEAERIKIKYGNVLPVEEENQLIIKTQDSENNTVDIEYSVLSEIIEARVEEIMSFVYKNIQKSGYYDNISTIVISGGGVSFLKGISEISKNIIGKNTRVALPVYAEAGNPVYSNCTGVIKYVSKESKLHELQIKSKEESNLPLNKEVKKTETGILLKIRNFFGDFF